MSLHINSLGCAWESGTALLMQLLSSSKNNQHYAPNPVAVVIKSADQMSTALNLRDKAFNNKPSFYYFASYEDQHGKQFVNRLVA